MDVHLIDGTYELFRYYFALPSHMAGGREVAATRGVLGDVVRLLEDGATHVGVATDHVIESFRNDLWPDYKTSAGVPDELLEQFELVEIALRALGVVVWAMVEREADDALASAASVCRDDPRVGSIVIRTVDKDLAQCVVDGRVVQYDRRKDVTLDSAAVRAKFGVPPGSIPDWLALVGDSADGFPGLPGWGAKSAATVLARYGSIESIPADADDWDVRPRGADKLASTLCDQRDLAMLFKDLATLRIEPAVTEDVDELRWTGPTPDFVSICADIDAADLPERAASLSARRREA